MPTAERREAPAPTLWIVFVTAISRAQAAALTADAIAPGVEAEATRCPRPDPIPQRGEMIRVHAEAFCKDQLDAGVDKLGGDAGHDEHGD